METEICYMFDVSKIPDEQSAFRSFAKILGLTIEQAEYEKLTDAEKFYWKVKTIS